MTQQEKKGKQSKVEEETRIVPISSAVFEEFLVEQVWFEKRAVFQLHRVKGNEPDRILDIIDSADEQGRPLKYVPIDNDHLRKGSVWIPKAHTDIQNVSFEDLWGLQDKLLDASFDSITQREMARLYLRICTSSWFIDKEETGIAGVGKFAPILPIRGLSGGGKSRFMFVCRACSYHPFYQSATNKIPSIYRPLENWKGVLFLNECNIEPNGKDKDLGDFLLARSYGDPISRQNPNNITESNAFNQFQLTVVTQRENFGENAHEGRSIPFYTEKSWQKLPTLETPEMIELAEQIQSTSLALRMKYYPKVEIKKDLWLETSDARLNAALLPLAALSEFDNGISILLNGQLKRIERQKTELKAQSDDGELTNYLFQLLQSEDGEGERYERHQGNTYYFLEKNTIEGEGDQEKLVKLPLTSTGLAYKLGFKSAKAVRQKLDALMHTEDLPLQIRPKDKVTNGGKPFKPVWFRVESLLKLFREFVPNFDQNKIPEDLIKPKELGDYGN